MKSKSNTLREEEKKTKEGWEKNPTLQEREVFFTINCLPLTVFYVPLFQGSNCLDRTSDWRTFFFLSRHYFREKLVYFFKPIFFLPSVLKSPGEVLKFGVEGVWSGWYSKVSRSIFFPFTFYGISNEKAWEFPVVWQRFTSRWWVETALNDKV